MAPQRPIKFWRISPRVKKLQRLRVRYIAKVTQDYSMRDISKHECGYIFLKIWEWHRHETRAFAADFASFLLPNAEQDCTAIAGLLTDIENKVIGHQLTISIRSQCCVFMITSVSMASPAISIPCNVLLQVERLTSTSIELPLSDFDL
jgi:hypothetical protein